MSVELRCVEVAFKNLAGDGSPQQECHLERAEVGVFHRKRHGWIPKGTRLHHDAMIVKQGVQPAIYCLMPLYRRVSILMGETSSRALRMKREAGSRLFLLTPPPSVLSLALSKKTNLKKKPEVIEVL